jgi:hypothetical protein
MYAGAVAQRVFLRYSLMMRWIGWSSAILQRVPLRSLEWFVYARTLDYSSIATVIWRVWPVPAAGERGDSTRLSRALFRMLRQP